MSRTSSPRSTSSSQEDLTLAPERPTTPRPLTPLAEETAAELTLQEITARFALEKEQRAETRLFSDKKHAGFLFAKTAEEKRIAEENRVAEEKRLADEKKKAEEEKLNASKFTFADKHARETETTSVGCKCTLM